MYNSVTVAPGQLKDLSVEDFKKRLYLSLVKWKKDQRSGVWLRIPTEKADLIPVAVDIGGMEFHHAQPGYVMLIKWLPDSPCTLPAYCSAHLGVGGMVLNKAGEVLVIVESKGPAAQEGWWKFPGGAVDAGEDITDACVREVLEETGVKVRFKKVLAFRHLLKFRFQRGDLYFLCLCEPEDENNLEIKMQESEVSACMWMPLEEYLQLNHVKSIFRHLEPIIRAAAAEFLSKPSLLLPDQDATTKTAGLVGFIEESVPNRFTGGKNLWYASKF
eukprot:TRINITY_DN8646_c0_g1_i1.p1 TRINITY_DN8646_c0_g1~~TRINITY_DN8646_c0_g1_i1.p1  ORF type:complete len:293 (+),score=92.49 TRINITY_DN8646_c0_g1_i1:63-881(+)